MAMDKKKIVALGALGVLLFLKTRKASASIYDPTAPVGTGMPAPDQAAGFGVGETGARDYCFSEDGEEVACDKAFADKYGLGY